MTRETRAWGLPAARPTGVGPHHWLTAAGGPTGQPGGLAKNCRNQEGVKTAEKPPRTGAPGTAGPALRSFWSISCRVHTMLSSDCRDTLQGVTMRCFRVVSGKMRCSATSLSGRNPEQALMDASRNHRRTELKLSRPMPPRLC